MNGVSKAAEIPADVTGDQKVNLDDVAVLSRDWRVFTEMGDLERLMFHWLMDGTADPGADVEKVYTDRSRYEPGGQCIVSVICRNESEDVYEGDVRLYITRHGQGVYTDRKPVQIGGQQATTTAFSWTAPGTDFQGYLVEAWLDNGACGVTAVDVSSDWKRYPRYGYMTEFYAGQALGRNTQMLDELCRDYHINSLQYYDWMWRHENVIERQGEQIVDPWVDWRGAAISYEVLRDSIGKAQERGMAALPYFQIYIGLDGYEQTSGVNPAWGMFSDRHHANQYHHKAGATNFWLFNPGNAGWQDHLTDEYTDALLMLGWDGVHLDQLGNIGGGSYYDYGGNTVDLEWAMQAMVNRSKDHLDYLEAIYPQLLGHDGLVFNLVDGGVGHWAADEIVAGSKTDIIYSELWSTETYGGVNDFIRYARRRSGGKAVVLAAYMNYYEENGGVFDTDSVLLANAAFFAGGAFHLELGDGEHMLAHEFFPARDKVMSDELRARLQRYYHFMTAYEKLLFDPELRRGDGGLQWIDVAGQTLSGNGSGDTIWFLNRGTNDYEIFHLINLRDNDGEWRNPAQTPPVLTDMTVRLRLGPDACVQNVYIASPDRKGIMRKLPFSENSDSRGAYLEIILPELAYWEMICIERIFNAPADHRYEAEKAILVNTAVDTDHPEYSGEGFVDQFEATYDSISFYVAIAAAGEYEFSFRYANGSAEARRSVFINGNGAGDVIFPPLGNWDMWGQAAQTVYLEPGVHQIVLFYGGDDSGAINLDYLQVN